MYYDTHIMDKNLSTCISGFVCEWNDLKRKLQQEGYVDATIETYQAAEFVRTQRHDEAHKLISSKLVDITKLDIMISMNTDKAPMSIVALSYPNLGFSTFYFREKPSTVDNAIRRYYNVDTTDLKYQSVQEAIDMYNEIRMSVNDEEIYDDICDEIDIWESVQVFMDAAEGVVDKIKAVIESHKRAMDIELRRAKKRLIADEYFKLEKRRTNQLKNLTSRVDRNMRLLLNISEN